MLTSELKTINLQRHASRVQAKVEKVWAQLTNPSPNILTKLGVPNLAKRRRKGAQFGELVTGVG